MSHQSPPKKGNIISRYVDPIRNAASMEGHVLMAETIAKLVAVVITSLGFFIWGKDVAGQYTDIVWLHYVTGLLFAAIAAWITDFAFSHFLENSMFQFLAFWKFDWIHTAIARDGWYITFLLRPLRWGVVTIIVAGLFWADWTSVYTLRSPIANAKQEHVERVDFSALRADQQRAISAVVSPIDGEIRQVRADIATSERNVVASNTDLARIASGGNSWAKSKLAAMKAKATKADKKRLTSLQAQRDKAYADVTSSTAQESSIALADDQAAQATESESKAAISTLFTQFGIGSKILTILFRLFLIVNFLINTPNWDVNRDGRIDGDDVTASARKNTTNPQPAQQAGGGGMSPAFAQRRKIGFQHYDDPPDTPESRTQFKIGGPVTPPTVPDRIAVAQCSTDIPPEQSAQNSPARNSTAPTVPSRATGVLADIKYWQKLSRMALERAHTQKREEKRQDNVTRYEAYRTMLEALGVRVERGEGYTLTFTHPTVYNTSDAAMRIVEEQYDILHNLKTRTA